MRPDPCQSNRRRTPGDWERQPDLIVGLDPGRHQTGTVIIRLNPTIGVVRAGRMDNNQLCDLLWTLDGLTIVGMEDFQLRPSAMISLRWNPLREVRLIGAVEEICRKRQVRLIHVTPAQAKKLITNERLKRLGTWSRNAHVSDAFRVLWVVLFGRKE